MTDLEMFRELMHGWVRKNLGNVDCSVEQIWPDRFLEYLHDRRKIHLDDGWEDLQAEEIMDEIYRTWPAVEGEEQLKNYKDNFCESVFYDLEGLEVVASPTSDPLWLPSCERPLSGKYSRIITLAEELFGSVAARKVLRLYQEEDL